MAQRRSTRGAFTSLADLELRAKEREASAAGPLWGEEAFAEPQEGDGSFDIDGHSDDGQVCYLHSATHHHAYVSVTPEYSHNLILHYRRIW